VETTDAGGLTGTATVTIHLTNVNETPTVAPDTFAVAENSANGTAVGSVIVNDPDLGDTLTFAVTGGNTGGAFAINAGTGQIRVANNAALDFETTSTFSLAVQATDAGGLTHTSTVTVALTNVHEAPTVDPAEVVLTTPPETPPPEPPPETPPHDEPLPEKALPLSADLALEKSPGSPDLPQSPIRSQREDSPAPSVPLKAGPRAVTVAADVPVDAAVSVHQPPGTIERIARNVRLTLPTAVATDRTGFANPFDAARLRDDLTNMKEQMGSQANLPFFAAGSAAGLTSVLTVGYVLWAVRGGWLVASLLAQMPAWRLVDPLVVLDYLDEDASKPEREKDQDEDDSLQTLLEHPAEEPPAPRPPAESADAATTAPKSEARSTESETNSNS
jgi:VCBS repeat-containing protein